MAHLLVNTDPRVCALLWVQMPVLFRRLIVTAKQITPYNQCECISVRVYLHLYTHTVWTSLFQSESDRGQCENLMIVGFWGPLFRDPSLPLQIPGLILPASCDKDQISVLSVSGGRMRWSVWVRRWRLWSRKCQLNLCPQPPVSAEEDTEAQGCVVTCPRLQSKFKSEPELESKASGSIQHLPKMPWGGIKRRD